MRSNRVRSGFKNTVPTHNASLFFDISLTNSLWGLIYSATLTYKATREINTGSLKGAGSLKEVITIEKLS